MKQGYQPGITFISAMRASRQKFFAVDEKDKTGMGENVPVGTCVSGFGNGTPGKYTYELHSLLIFKIPTLSTFFRTVLSVARILLSIKFCMMITTSSSRIWSI